MERQTAREKQRYTARELQRYTAHLIREERAAATVEKYARDVGAFLEYVTAKEHGRITKQAALGFREEARKNHTAASVNTMLSAVNGYLKFKGKADCQVKLLKIQRQSFSDRERELSETEYHRLVAAAKRKGSERLSLVIRTICATGIRVSELKFITAEAVGRGRAEVSLKGKQRLVFITRELQGLLKTYMKKQHIESGPVFVTKSGRPLDRSNIWSDMKKLCASAKVSPRKVFPHALRHLFARAFYKLEKDIVRLADILGHSSIETTRIYTITSGAEHERIMNRMRLVC